MKFLNFLFLFFFYISLNNTHAEIFYIDIDRIINQTIVGKYINSEFENAQKKNNVKNTETKNELKKREESLISQKNILDENQFNNELNIFRKDVSDFNQLVQRRNEDIQNKLLNDKAIFLKLIEPILLEYVAEKNITYLLQKKYIIVGHNNLNKTADIIELVDKKISISNFNDSIYK